MSTTMKKVSFVSVPERIPSSCTVSEHATERFDQRNIGKLEIQHVLKNGSWSQGYPRRWNGNPTSIYTHKRLVCVVDDVLEEIVTAYTLPEKLEPKKVTLDLLEKHKSMKIAASSQEKNWKSYTVVVVDTSGSMRKSDVLDSKTRLEAVWKALANDYIAQRIEDASGGLEDAISVLSLGEECKVLLENEPTTWILYNKICELQNKQSARARGHGYYLPSLNKAEQLLLKHRRNSSCAFNLVFLSDGRPSDFLELRTSLCDSWDKVESHMMELARKFGCLLNFSAIGIGNHGDFEVLVRMVETAKDFGAKASFMLPSKTSASIGTSFTASATALATLQTEITGSTSNENIRLFLSESRKEAKVIPQKVTRENFNLYPVDEVRRET